MKGLHQREEAVYTEELYSENSKIVYHFLYSQCHDAALAEDLTQETFLQAYKSLENFDGSCKISVWLCQIAKHLFYRHLQKAGRDMPYLFVKSWLPNIKNKRNRDTISRQFSQSCLLYVSALVIIAFEIL